MNDKTGDICAATNNEQVEQVLKDDYGFVNGQIQQLDGYDEKNYYITVRI